MESQNSISNQLWQIHDTSEETDRYFDFKKLQGITIKTDFGKNRTFTLNKKKPEDKVAAKVHKVLKELSRKYSMKFNKVKEIFKRVSSSKDDFEDYVVNKNDLVLWEDYEDEILKDNITSGMSLLKKLKGQKRIDRRKRFLNLLK